VRKSFPVISIDDITAIIYEPDAGVVRARRACQHVSAVFEMLGGKMMIGRASPSKISNGRLEEISLDTGAKLRADTFVYCVGPWLGKTFPEIFAKKTRAPIGYVCYFGTPINDQRFTFPNLPSYNFPGVTGWAALPVDNRGFRVRGAERAPGDPGGRGGAGGPAGAAAPGGANASGANPTPANAANANPANPNAANAPGGRAAVAEVDVAAEVAEVRTTRTYRRRSRIRIPAIAGPTCLASRDRAGSSRIDSRCSRMRRSHRRTPVITSRR
jgi:hypothetical protein